MNEDAWREWLRAAPLEILRGFSVLETRMKEERSDATHVTISIPRELVHVELPTDCED